MIPYKVPERPSTPGTRFGETRVDGISWPISNTRRSHRRFDRRFYRGRFWIWDGREWLRGENHLYCRRPRFLSLFGTTWRIW